MIPHLFILAQISSPLPPPTAEEFFSVLKCIGVIAVIIALGLHIWRQIQGVPPPGDKFATKEELARLIHEVAELREDFKAEREKEIARYNEMMRSSAEGRSRLHKEINATDALVHRVEGIVETLRESVRDLANKSKPSR